MEGFRRPPGSPAVGPGCSARGNRRKWCSGLLYIAVVFALCCTVSQSVQNQEGRWDRDGEAELLAADRDPSTVLAQEARPSDGLPSSEDLLSDEGGRARDGSRSELPKLYPVGDSSSEDQEADTSSSPSPSLPAVQGPVGRDGLDRDGGDGSPREVAMEESFPDAEDKGGVMGNVMGGVEGGVLPGPADPVEGRTHVQRANAREVAPDEDSSHAGRSNGSSDENSDGELGSSDPSNAPRDTAPERLYVDHPRSVARGPAPSARTAGPPPAPVNVPVKVPAPPVLAAVPVPSAVAPVDPEADGDADIPPILDDPDDNVGHWSEGPFDDGDDDTPRPHWQDYVKDIAHATHTRAGDGEDPKEAGVLRAPARASAPTPTTSTVDAGAVPVPQNARGEHGSEDGSEQCKSYQDQLSEEQERSASFGKRLSDLEGKYTQLKGREMEQVRAANAEQGRGRDAQQRRIMKSGRAPLSAGVGGSKVQQRVPKVQAAPSPAPAPILAPALVSGPGQARVANDTKAGSAEVPSSVDHRLMREAPDPTVNGTVSLTEVPGNSWSSAFSMISNTDRPKELEALKALIGKQTAIDYCDWQGVTCDRHKTTIAVHAKMLGIKAIPPLISSLKHLRSINLANNEIEEIPEELFGLSSLESLTLDNNAIRVLPESVSRLQALSTLSMEQNKLEDTPAGLEELSNLKILRLTRNSLAIFPNVTALPQLRVLDLSDNKIQAIPTAIRQMTSLRFFSARNNLMTLLPTEIGELVNMQLIDLSMNRLMAIPNSIGQLGQLSDILLQNNRLTEIPTSFGQLHSLVNCFLWGNELRALPSSFANLHKLIQLNVARNRLSLLPDVFDSLLSLITFNVQSNVLVRLPSSLNSLERLRHLKAASNHLSALPRLDNLRSLEILDLSSNDLTHLERWTFDGLPNLLSLNLNNNTLTEVPYFDHLPSLRSLTLRTNNITDLPSWLLTIPRPPVRHLALENNPFNETLIGGRALKFTKRYPSFFFVCKMDLAGGKQCWGYCTSADIESRRLGSHQFLSRTGHCFCQAGYYHLPDSSCASCPDNGVCENAQVQCTEGFLPTMVKGGNGLRECSDCPPGFLCHQKDLQVKVGYWRGSQASHVTYECPRRDRSCLGGVNSTGVCTEGYTGILCTVCESGYFSSGNYRCAKCPEHPWIVVLWWLVLNIGATIILLAVLAKSDSSSSLRILINFSQVTLSVTTVYEVAWPDLFKLFSEHLSFVNLDFLNTAQLGCAMDQYYQIDFYTHLVMKMFLPFTLLSFLGSFWLGVLVYKRIFPTSNISLQHVGDHMIRLVVLVAMYTYLPVSQTLFKFFDCKSFNDYPAHWLAADYRVQCFTRKYGIYQVVVIVWLVLFTFGLPFFMLILLTLLRRRLKEKKLQIRFGFWFSIFKPKYYYWYTIDLMRILIIGGFGMFFSKDAVYSLTVVIAVAFGFFTLHLTVRPFRYAIDNLLQGVCLLLLQLYLAVGLVENLNMPTFQFRIFSYTVLFLTITLMGTVIVWQIYRFNTLWENRRIGSKLRVWFLHKIGRYQAEDRPLVEGASTSRNARVNRFGSLAIDPREM